MNDVPSSAGGPPSPNPASAAMAGGGRVSAFLRIDGATSRPALTRGRWRWLLYMAGWTLVGVHFGAWIIGSAAIDGTEIPWSQVVSEIARWYIWALLVPIIWWAAVRFPLERKRLASRLLINLAVGLSVTLLFVVLDLLMRELITALLIMRSTGGFVFRLRQDLVSYFFWGMEYNLVAYFGIVAVVHAYHYHAYFRERELKASRLEAQLALARLEVLKMQLHPHFLFNTLNAISALMHRDVDAADRMISLLSDLLRLSLDKDDRHQVSLRSELEFLDRYLAIEKIRFRDRLLVEMDVDPPCLGAQVPRLILQPLVENSIRHGIALHSSAGLVAIRARRKGNRLDLSVSDDGPGLDGNRPPREGVGLANTRARLIQLYGEDHRFRLERADAGGLRVHMEIPFEEQPRLVAAG
jgi:two-component system, LytTR family, sensor kinase